MYFVLSQLDEIWNELTRGPSGGQHRVPDTTNTNGQDTDADQPRRRVCSRSSFEMKKKVTLLTS